MTPPDLAAAQVEDFFIPGVHDGLAILPCQDLRHWQVPPVQVSALALASDVTQRLKTAWHFGKIRRNIWSAGVAFPTALCVAENVHFSGKEMLINGRYFISSAGGHRLLNRYAQVGSTHSGERPVERLANYFLEQSSKNEGPLPIASSGYEDLPLVFQARNFFNYYHFLKETLPLLTLVNKDGLKGEIYLVTGSGAKVAGFVHNLIATWFPELSSRIHLVRSPKTFEQAIVALDTRYFYYQCSSEIIPCIEGVSNHPVGRKATMANMRVSAINSYESPLVNLRELVSHRIGVSSSPKRRLYVKRRSVRDRRVVNGEYLEACLKDIGFEAIAFEDLTVEDQARAVAESECIVSLHGAGLANMLYAPKGCLIVELSNLQTLLKRFGDFNPLALAAGVRYLHMFLDHDFPDLSKLPSISSNGHLGVNVSKFSASVITSRISAELSPEEFESSLDNCRAANDARDLEDLRCKLAASSGILFHEADWHVWSANCSALGGDRASEFKHLSNALLLASDRVPLLKRILGVAQDLKHRERFLEATACFMQTSPEQCREYLERNNWSVDGPG